MNLLSHGLVPQLTWPVITHCYGLIGSRISQIIQSLLCSLSDLPQLSLRRILHRFVTHFPRRDLARLRDKLLQRHVQVVEAVKIHLSLIELVLEVETLLDELKLNEG